METKFNALCFVNHFTKIMFIVLYLISLLRRFCFCASPLKYFQQIFSLLFKKRTKIEFCKCDKKVYNFVEYMSHYSVAFMINMPINKCYAPVPLYFNHFYCHCWQVLYFCIIQICILNLYCVCLCCSCECTYYVTISVFDWYICYKCNYQSILIQLSINFIYAK